MDLESKIRKLEKRIKDLENGGEKKPKQKRAPSEYNKFMKTEGVKIKSKNPTWSQPDIMREVARLWKEKQTKTVSASTSKSPKRSPKNSPRQNKK